MLPQYLSAILCLCLVHFSSAQNPINCITCDTNTNNDCISDLTKFTPEQCLTNTCYTRFAQGVLSRGCIDTPTSVTAASCTAENNCVQCTTENCNAAQTVCQTCNSGTDPACAQLISTNVNYNTVCSETNAQCYVGLDGVNTVRRCATTADTNCAPTNTAVVGVTCQLCNGANCNNQLYPQDRLKCYHCAANTADASCNNPTAQGTTQSAIACQNYKTDDRCFTHGTSATTMVRGCVSDTDSTLCGTTNTDTACATCGTNGCNKNQYTYQPSLQCIQCNSKDQANCAAQQEASTATNCNVVSYTTTEQCYTQLIDNFTYRGCLSARSTDLAECTSENNCVTCSAANGCNNGLIIKCKQCNTNNDVQCTSGSKTVTSVVCSASECYETWTDRVFERGCLAKANDTVRERCSATPATVCETCNTNDCNTKNSAALNTFAVSLLTVTALFTIKSFV